MLGWFLGAGVDLIVAWFVGIDMNWAVISTAIALALFWVVIYDTGGRFVRCNPDDFIRIIVSMDSAFLIIVNIPIFILAEVLLSTSANPQEVEQQPIERQ